MNRPNRKIKDSFERYNCLVCERKIVVHDSILLADKENNVHWQIGVTPVKHSLVSDSISLIVERSKRGIKYGIKLQCKDLTDVPYFRFDSSGPAHRNYDESTALEYQNVLTPHFNKFLENGTPYAYQSEELKDENICKAIEDDANLGLSLFCKETNSMLNDGRYPSIMDKFPEIEFGINDLVDYDNIKFL